MPRSALVLERFRNIRQIQRINDKLNEVYDDFEDAGVDYSRLRVLDWRAAKYEPAGKPILFTRIRGSPQTLEEDALFLATYAEVRETVETYSVDDEIKTAVAAITAADIVQKPKVDYTLGKASKERLRDIDLVRRKVLREKLPVPALLRSVSRAGRDIPVTQGNRAFFNAIAQYEEIAEKAVQKPEFLEVLKSRGNIDVTTLEGMYSALMALVLRNPGRTLSDYHELRLGITKIDRVPAATKEELWSLVDLGYLTFDRRKRYWPNYTYIKKRHGISPPKIVTLFKWIR